MDLSDGGERRAGDIFWLQALNVIVANFVLTELFLDSSSSSDSQPRRVRRALAGGAVLLLVNAGATVGPRIHAAVGGQWIPVAALALPLTGGAWLAHARPTLAPALRMAGVGLLVLAIGHWVAEEHVATGWSEPLRALVVAGCFAAVAYGEVSAARTEAMPLRRFALSAAAAAAKAICLVPWLAVGIGAVFVTLDNSLQTFGVADGWLNTPIYLSVLYGPLASIYWFLKRDLRRESRLLLPV